MATVNEAQNSELHLRVLILILEHDCQMENESLIIIKRLEFDKLEKK